MNFISTASSSVDFFLRLEVQLRRTRYRKNWHILDDEDFFFPLLYERREGKNESLEIYMRRNKHKLENRFHRLEGNLLWVFILKLIFPSRSTRMKIIGDFGDLTTFITLRNIIWVPNCSSLKKNVKMTLKCTRRSSLIKK